MAFTDGDPFVSGSLYSFQQGNRMMQNYRGASVPSNLQDGALWSDSGDDKLWHQGTDDLLEVFTEKTTLTWENLLSNSGFGVWSRSGPKKGLATITYDQGAKGGGAAPSVGDAIVAGTSGTTAKLISYTIASGTWDAGTAAGVLTVGAISHDFAFVDNETLTFDGVETCVINMPDSAVQVGLVQNGGFATDTDPPPGWTAASAATLTTEGAGKVTNCLMITGNGVNNPRADQDVTVEPGKIYKLNGYVKAGTEDEYQIQLYDNDNAADIWGGAGWGTAAGDWSTNFNHTFEAPVGCTSVAIRLFSHSQSGEGKTLYYDEVTLYEITPVRTGADNRAPDGWYKDTTCNIYRQHSDATYTKDGSFYSLKVVPTAAEDFVYFPAGFPANEEWLKTLTDQPVTFGAWIYASTANHARLRIREPGSTYSSYHSGTPGWEWLEITAIIDTAATQINFHLQCVQAPNVDGSTIVYISQPMLVLGSSIGEGNYQPKPQEFIWLEKAILSNTYDGLLNQSDLAFTDLNLEADSDAMIPKGAKVIAVHTEIEDSASGAGLDVHLELRKDATAGAFYCNSVAGKPNDVHSHQMGLQPCDVNGDIDIHIDASGASTFDVVEFEYHGVQVN